MTTLPIRLTGTTEGTRVSRWADYGLLEACRADRRHDGLLARDKEKLGFRSVVHRSYIGGVERAERQPSVMTLAHPTCSRGLNVCRRRS
ncbi:MAG TPA: hypothetical protein VII01_06020 [Solirubrobacteraceae bacterium]|jgi:hypothetical protein